MNTRFTGNTMTLEHFHDFYYLEALMAGITMARSSHPEWEFRHSLERLETDVKEAFEHLTHEMALRIYVYLYAAAMGEARYAQDFGLNYYVKGLRGKGRNDVYEMAIEYFPTPENIEVLKNVFSQKWGGSYGGKAWKSIVDAMDLYGKVSEATFIDHSVDLEHNGGCVFSKSANFGLDCFAHFASDLKYFLDFKFSENILEKQFYSPIRISRKVYKLIDRFINVTTSFGSDKHLKMLITLYSLVPTLEWLDGYTIDWGNKTLETVGTKPEPKAKEKIVTKGHHVHRVVSGKKYLVKYDGRCHDCGWDRYSMGPTNGTIISINGLNSSGFGNCKGWWYTRHWLYEVEKSAEVAKPKGNEVVVKKNANRIRSMISFLEGMYIFLGKKCRVISRDGQIALVKYDDKQYYMPYRWLRFPERQERRERRRREYELCPSCGTRLDEYNSSYSTTEWKSYCDECYSEKFKTCDKCGGEVYTDCAVDAEHHHKYYWLCEGCADSVMTKCDGCGEYYEDYIITEDTQNYFCESCADGMYCRKCNSNYEDKREHDKRHERRTK